MGVVRTIVLHLRDNNSTNSTSVNLSERASVLEILFSKYSRLPKLPLLTFISSYILWLNTLKGTTKPLTEVILDFSTLRGTTPRIVTPKRYDDRPRKFYIGVPPREITMPAWLHTRSRTKFPRVYIILIFQISYYP